MAKKPATQPNESPAAAADQSDLALRICARTGMGLTVCRERMAGNEEKLSQLLDANDMAGVVALLEPSNKA